MKPKSIRAALQLMLPEIEEMMSLGVSRAEIYKAVSERFGLEGVNVRSFDTSLYRARQIRKNGMHNTHGRMPNNEDSVLHNTQNGGSEKGAEESVLHNTQTPPEPEPQGSEKKKVPALLIKSSSIKSVKISTLRCSTKNSEVIYESSGN
ncbi:plasmid stabilization protein StbA (plasmid) [Klebsiella pneumoniae]|uniref:Stable plasmid inheritance protein StbA n=3 Tax=Escherichia coli TaxID=562 RepID=A0A9Q7XY02_ECOLX|nr:plasmid stabilization protein StbA [Escherichia coli]WAD66208.1 plasmid stabilization protein StbA [Klebsiella pneumoniae]MCQ6627819.1 StbA [Escherichia coli]MDM4859321.1 plasmid stabilization protein StbA [Escherichia coli]MDM4983147.1 plasmid stabilization protein StbA [Escherichia coli]MDM5002794.1 plasmid stabilization protein StbA [Escherichia coli]